MMSSLVNNDMSSSKILHDGSAVILFSATEAKNIENLYRIPPTHVGVKRLRASSRSVLDACRNRSSDCNGSDHVKKENVNRPNGSSLDQLRTHESIVYKIKGKDGVVRRMTNQEKKQFKMKLRKDKMLAKQSCQERCSVEMDQVHHNINSKLSANISESATDSDLIQTPGKISSQESMEAADEKPPANDVVTSNDDLVQVQKKKYYKLEVNKDELQEEILELTGENKRVAPVIFSSPMVIQARQNGLFQSLHIDQSPKKTIIDNSLSHQWAIELKKSMTPAETVRSKEDIRPMAYMIVPEVWSRLSSSLSTSKNVDKDGHELKQTQSQCGGESASIRSSNEKREVEWSFVTTRPIQSNLDRNLAIVYECLYLKYDKLHISCGAKFGCDFILYDGHREDRHGFAGLRVYSCERDESDNDVNSEISKLHQETKESMDQTKSSTGEVGRITSNSQSLPKLPLPSAYDIAGYVRGLNTAGKLALIATVIHHKHTSENGDLIESHHVAIVDLALEKNLMAPTHMKKKEKRKRKDVGLNLEKRRAP